MNSSPRLMEPAAKENVPRRRRWGRLSIAGAVGVLLLGGGGLAWHRHETTGLVRRALSGPPDLSNAHPAFRERLADVVARTAKAWSPAVPLGEAANLYYVNGYTDAALGLYRELMLLEPRNPKWSHFLGGILSGYGAIDEALPLLRLTTELAPDYLPARMRLADALQKAGRKTEAAESYRKGQTLDPTSPFPSLGLARLEISEGHWAEARTHLKDALSREPAFQLAWSLLTTVNEKLSLPPEKAPPLPREGNAGQREIADPWLDELAEDCYDAYRVDVLAGAAASAGNDTRAMKLYERAVSLAPDNPATHRILGTYLLKAKRPAEAREALEKAVRLAPEDSGNWTRLILALNLLGEKEAAAKALDDGLRHCPNSPGMRMERGRKYAAQGKIEEALAEFSESIRLRPEEPQVYLDGATVCFRSGQSQRGLKFLEGLLSVSPEHPVALLSLGQAAIESGNEQEARSWHKRILGQRAVRPEFVEKFTADFTRRFGNAP